jgi:Inhibitor of growth proteins N-terminal histone-binding
MAYRRATGASEAKSTAVQAPSFLDEFLDQIAPLPAQVKTKFAELRDLDDRVVTLMSEAERASVDAVKKASTKSTGGNDPLKRAFQEVLACQAKAGECSSKKMELAENAYQLIEDTIKTLDDTLREYEAQLKKEGRWPASTDRKDTRKLTGGRFSLGGGGSALAAGLVPGDKATGGGAAVVSRVEEAADEVDTMPVGPGVAGVTTGNQRSRKRDREKALAKAAQEKERAFREVDKETKKGTKTEPVVAADAQASGMSVIEDMNIPDDEPRYCYCHQVSYGDMVGCEADDCTYQWFHYVCVGLTSEPKGDWYCPECSAKLKKKKKKK